LPRKRDIEAAVAAYNATDRERFVLPPEAARLLTVMFHHNDVWEGRFEDLATERFDRKVAQRLLLVLVETGFLSPTDGKSIPPAYRLHLPPRRQR
jgi:hypothetical protein